MSGFKEFWTSRSVKISIAIFSAIALVMGIIILISMLAGCSTNYHKQVKRPALVLHNIGHHGNFTRPFLAVANPSDYTIKGTVKCCVPYERSECIEEKVIVPPHSDKQVSFNTLTGLTCRLDIHEVVH